MDAHTHNEGSPQRRAVPVALFAGGGAMGAAMLAHDWAATPLGPIETWSRPLTGAVGIMLTTPIGMVLFWGEAAIPLYNDSYACIIGDHHPALLGSPHGQAWPEMWHRIGPLLKDIRETGRSLVVRDEQPSPDTGRSGQGRFFDLSYSPVREADGRVGGVLCIFSETTDRVVGQRRADAERARLARMFEQAPSFMALLQEPDHVFEFVNTSFLDLIGHRRVAGLPIGAALPELVGQPFLALMDAAIAARQPRSAQGLSVSLAGPGRQAEQRTVDVVFQPILDPHGKVTGLFVDGSDVTGQVRAERQLAASESALRLATEAAEVGTWDLDLETGRLDWTDRTRAMFGISPAVPCTMTDFYGGLHPEDRDAVSAAFAAALDPARRVTYDVEYRTIGKEDGLVRWVAAKGRGIFVGDICVRAVGTAIDITRRREVEQSLRESERRFRSLADTAPALIWMCDADGALVFANRWHEELFGRPVEDMLGLDWQAIIHPDDLPAFAAAFDEAFAARRPFQRDVRVIDRDNNVRWLHSEARPRDFEGRFAGYVGCDVDVTDAHLATQALERGIAERTGELAATTRQLSTQIEERERAEATLGQMQRLEAIGQLTSGVAHDFNNLLTVILGNVDMIERIAAEGTDNAPLRKRIGHVRSAAERGAALTAQLLAFSRRQRLAPRATDLNTIIPGMRDLLHSSMGGSVQLSIVQQPDLWPALVDPTQIELIILNLAINARDAMAVGGSLVIESANVTLGDPVQPEEPAAGDYVMVAVKDSGTGMTAEVLAKAFEPFFTTKPVGKGSGLGLPQVFGFARQSGGGVRIETAVGQGTTVRVYLPRSTASVSSGAAGEADAVGIDRGAKGRHVLVVDDDHGVREVSASVLRSIGATVTEADSGEAALALLQSVQGAFDLMVVDLAMPGMNGADLAAVAARNWPRLPVLFVTGYADLSLLAAIEVERVVQKPYRREDFCRKAMRLLGTPA